MKMELRVQNAELDANSDGALKVSGYVNKTNQYSEILGTTKRFKEKIAKGAFSKAIREAKQINFLAEHDSKKILASTRNSSLELTEDEQGLFMSANISPTSWGRDSFQLIKDGILQNMSFGFRTIRDSWKNIGANLYERTIEELELFEVSVVEKPAYTSSTIAARGIELVEQVDVPEKITQRNQKERIENMKTAETIKYGIETRSEKAIQFERFGNYFKEERNIASTGDHSEVIPEHVHDEIIKKIELKSPIFELARKFPSVSGTLTIGRENDSTEAGFVGEGRNIVELAFSFADVKLEQKRVGAAMRITNQLANDAAMNIVDYIGRLLAERTGKAIETSMLIGKGGNEFKGIVHDADVPVIEKTFIDDKDGTIEVPAVHMDDVMDLYTAIPFEYLEGSAFIMNRSFYNEVAKLKNAAGHYYVQNGVVNGKPSQTLLGRPIFTTDVLPTNTPIIFGNIEQAYGIMIKKGAQLQQIVDTNLAVKGAKLYLYDGYMDGAVYNPQAIVKLVDTTV